jgi:hypothetical protein
VSVEQEITAAVRAAIHDSVNLTRTAGESVFDLYTRAALHALQPFVYELEQRRQVMSEESRELNAAKWNELRAALAAVTGERDDALQMLADFVFKATEYGTQDGDFVANYLLPTGPIHRAIPWLEQRGINVRPGFDGRPTEKASAKAVSSDG